MKHPLNLSALPIVVLSIGHRACWFSGTLSPDICCQPNHHSCWDGFFSFDLCCQNKSPKTEERFKIMDEILGTCFDRIEQNRSGSGLDELACRGGSHELIRESFWKTLFFNQRLAKVSVGDSVVVHDEIAEAFFVLMSKDPKRFMKDCAQGVAVLVLHLLPEISSRFGADEAKRWYEFVLAETRKFGANLGRDCRWVDMVHFHAFDHYPIFMEKNRQDCPVDLKIFSYRSSLFEADSAMACYARNKFWNTEVLWPTWLESSHCSTEKMDDADFIYMPIFWTCWELISHKKDTPEVDFVAIGEEIVRTIKSHGAWSKPQKHVWLFSSASWPLFTFEPLQEFIKKGIILAVEPNPHLQPSWGGQTGRDIDLDRAEIHTALLRKHLGLVVPAVVPFELSRRLLHQDEGRRNFFATFHGQHARSSVPKVAQKYKSFNETVRPQLIEIFANETSTSVGLPTIAYMETMSQSVFCLCPQGISSYTARLFEAFFAGCIPVILSDDYSPPTYGGLVPWREFSIKWNSTDLAGLRDYLRMLLADFQPVVKDMLRKVKKYRCWFDWFIANRIAESRERACSPYAGVLKSLSDIKMQGDPPEEFLPQFWWPV